MSLGALSPMECHKSGGHNEIQEADRSTCLASTCTPQRVCNNSAVSAKLTSEAVVPTIRSIPSESELLPI